MLTIQLNKGESRALQVAVKEIPADSGLPRKGSYLVPVLSLFGKIYNVSACDTPETSSLVSCTQEDG